MLNNTLRKDIFVSWRNEESLQIVLVHCVFLQRRPPVIYLCFYYSLLNYECADQSRPWLAQVTVCLIIFLALLGPTVEIRQASPSIFVSNQPSFVILFLNRCPLVKWNFFSVSCFFAYLSLSVWEFVICPWFGSCDLVTCLWNALTWMGSKVRHVPQLLLKLAYTYCRYYGT